MLCALEKDPEGDNNYDIDYLIEQCAVARSIHLLFTYGLVSVIYRPRDNKEKGKGKTR
jgi:hypothetical protein